MTPPRTDPRRYVIAISRSGLSIYDPIDVGDPELWIPTTDLEILLDTGLRGISLAGLPLRTRSKIVKEHVCRVLGYPLPTTFRKTQPRFPGQCFDTYVQKANNLQVWNEELEAIRRYVLIRQSEDGTIRRVKVVTGDRLAELDRTGTLTQKYQARCVPGPAKTELVTHEDTALLRPYLSPTARLAAAASPIDQPYRGQLLPIAVVFDRLARLVGVRFRDRGCDQERNRGAGLHMLVCKTLGYSDYRDDGQFPDVRHQLVEVKLQTAPTIDLGLICPNSQEALDVRKLNGDTIRHCDVRYAVFYGEICGDEVEITHCFLTTGEAFFGRFPQFQGKILNKKLQIPLPAHFFD